MDEAEWMACAEPLSMLEFRLGKLDSRKMRLFACACCRRLWQRLTDERIRKAVELAERYADARLFPHREVRRALADAPDAAAEDVCAWVGAAVGPFTETVLVWQTASLWRAGAAEGAVQATLLREVLGNPFCPVSLDPAWQTPTIVALAQAAYEERILLANSLDPDRLAVLSDALEDAGCDDTEILTHLRGPGPHVRGCFVVDLLLGKE